MCVAQYSVAAALCALLPQILSFRSPPRHRRTPNTQRIPNKKKVYERATGRLVGLVTEYYDTTGEVSTLRIRLAPSRGDVAASVMRTTLLPFAAEIVPAVDVARGRMEVCALLCLCCVRACVKGGRENRSARRARAYLCATAGWHQPPQQQVPVQHNTQLPHAVQKNNNTIIIIHNKQTNKQTNRSTRPLGCSTSRRAAG